MVKYIFVTGGVLSSVGKGILTSSIGKMLQTRGLKVNVIKIDPYVNVDAGTMNPYMHGEVFVTDDGGETDLDLGWYERFLDLSLKQENNLTTGMVYKSVIEKERRGDFLGRCVQIVPHVTQEMKTKPLQHSVNELRRIGIQPDIIVARSPTMIDAEALRKIALFGTIPENAVFCSYNVETIYQVPLILDKQGMGDFICRRLCFDCTSQDFGDWQQVVNAILKPENEVKVALVGKYAGLSDSYVSMSEALRHGGAANRTRVSITYLEAERLEQTPECVNDLK